LIQFLIAGYKFETVATLDKPWGEVTREDIENRRRKPTNNIEQYCSVVRTGIGNVRLLLAGEVDCVNDYKPAEGDGDPLQHYVELKTTRIVDDDRSAMRLESKLLKAWGQSFLLGVPKIVYGFRDDNGFLRCVEEYKTEHLPLYIKNSQATPRDRQWNGVDAIAFYGAVLDWIRKSIKAEGIVWRLQYKAGAHHLDLFQLKEEESKEKYFLLQEFVDWRNELKRQGHAT
jgi:RAT1-interacting protein